MLRRKSSSLRFSAKCSKHTHIHIGVTQHTSVHDGHVPVDFTWVREHFATLLAGIRVIHWSEKGGWENIRIRVES